GQTDAPDQLAGGGVDRDAAVAHRAAGIAGAPQVAVDVGAHAVGAALDAVDHEVAEDLVVGELVVRRDVVDVHVALAAGARVAGALAGADDVELLEVRREAQAVGVGTGVFAGHLRDRAALVDAIDGGGQLA